MKKLLFIFCLAFMAAIHAMAAEPDTLRVYNIDGQLLRKFTGKELIGKTIKSYNIYYASDMDGKRVIESHRIKTTTPPPSTKPTPRYFVDDLAGEKMKEVTHEEMNKISPSKIVSIKCIKAGSKAAEELSRKDDKKDIIIITVKNNPSENAK